MLEKVYGSGTITQVSQPFDLWDAQRELWGDLRLIQIHGNLVVLQGRKRSEDTDWVDVMTFAIHEDNLVWALHHRKGTKRASHR